MRTAMWTAMPRTSSPSSSNSPVWTAARHLDLELGRHATDLLGGPDGALGTVEASDESVARRRDLASPEPIEQATHRQVVPAQEVARGSVAHGQGVRRGVDDIGHEERADHPVVAAALGAREGLSLIHI